MPLLSQNKFGMMPIECEWGSANCGGGYVPQGPAGDTHFWIPGDLDPYSFIPYTGNNAPNYAPTPLDNSTPIAIANGIISHKTVASVMAAQNAITSINPSVSTPNAFSEFMRKLTQQIKDNPIVGVGVIIAIASFALKGK